MTPLDLEPLARWLRCPRCSEALSTIEGLVLGCTNGHRYDTNKRGYVSMLSGTKFTGDTAEILSARARFLERGHYAPIAEAVASRIPDAAETVIDSGCGTGYYLASVLNVRPTLAALALDVSPAAVARTVAATRAPGLVADIWAPLPIRDATADVVLCVFAPRNPAEFARVVTPRGALIIVTPTSGHLRELREAGAVIGLQPDKLEHLDESLAPHFTLGSRAELEYSLTLDASEAALLAGMGPSGHHERSTAPDAGTVTASVHLSVFSPR